MNNKNEILITCSGWSFKTLVRILQIATEEERLQEIGFKLTAIGGLIEPTQEYAIGTKFIRLEGCITAQMELEHLINQYMHKYFIPDAYEFIDVKDMPSDMFEQTQIVDEQRQLESNNMILQKIVPMDADDIDRFYSSLCEAVFNRHCYNDMHILASYNGCQIIVGIDKEDEERWFLTNEDFEIIGVPKEEGQKIVSNYNEYRELKSKYLKAIEKELLDNIEHAMCYKTNEKIVLYNVTKNNEKSKEEN